MIYCQEIKSPFYETTSLGKSGKNANQHEIGKKNTQKIERKNLNLWTWVKRLTWRTICFLSVEKCMIRSLDC
jgi:IS1 family transposase